MASTLAGVFDDYDDAERARERLASAGFRREAIQVTPERSAWGTGDATHGGRAAQSGGLRGFFSSLFGTDDESPGHYSEAVRRGSMVVTVEIDDDSQISRATEILEDCGALRRLQIQHQTTLVGIRKREEVACAVFRGRPAAHGFALAHPRQPLAENHHRRQRHDDRREPEDRDEQPVERPEARPRRDGGDHRDGHRQT
jgi:hypothetical protein